MAKQCFVERRFSRSSLGIIAQANQIIAEYVQQGFILTLRQLYYQMVARDIIPNTIQSYKRLGSILNDARYAGLVDWSAMEDRTRNMYAGSHWENPADIINSAAASFALDKWINQAFRPEVWIEKEALAGVVQRVARQNDVGYLSCRGYMSASEMYEAARRMVQRYDQSKQQTLIIYLGDHDPSGLDMSEGDIPKRFEIFMSGHAGRFIKVNRIALNWEQIEQYNPPPNPAKETDSRFQVYQEQFGDSSWELDALEPSILTSLIQEAIDEVKDPIAYAKMEKKEEQGRALLFKASDNWDGVVEYLEEI